MKEKKSYKYSNGIGITVLYIGIILLLLTLIYVGFNLYSFDIIKNFFFYSNQSLTNSSSNLIDISVNISKFNSCNELANKITNDDYNNFDGFYDFIIMSSQAKNSYSPKLNKYSTTNVQVKGIDEADLVKTDGEYIYSISKSKNSLRLNVIKGYPVTEAKVESSIPLLHFKSNQIIKNYEFFINNNNKLIAFIYFSDYDNDEVMKNGFNLDVIRYPYKSFTLVKIYDISDKKNPILIDEYEFTMDYISSRMINDSVYIIMNYLPNKETKILYNEYGLLPLMRNNKSNYVPMAKCNEVYDLSDDQNISSYIGIVKISLNDNKPRMTKELIAGKADVIYVSYDNIYTISKKYRYFNNASEVSLINKISIKNGQISYVGKAIVPGYILNQFSVDEYEGYLRIATTSTNYEITRIYKILSSNNIYILDENLNLVGKLEGLAIGENLHSARFMGRKGYLVTFKKVDPLFVIDLSNPKKPKVLGKLKIPGYSDYLHPINDKLLLGIGKNTVEADEGDFAWYQGLKIAIFDVSDYNNPKELSYLEIGDRGTESEVLTNHKAFLYDERNNLIVLPVLLAEIDEFKYSGNVHKWEYGDYTFQGVYVVQITKDNKLRVKGRITHFEDDQYFKEARYYYSPKGEEIKRALYINDYLYTISDKIVKINRINDLAEVKKIVLLN